MLQGKIQAAGSTLELKKQFGTGYLLHILKAANFDEAQVLAAVHAHVDKVRDCNSHCNTLQHTAVHCSTLQHT